MIAEPGTLVHLPAGTMHWFRYGQGGGEMISMTSREAASHYFTDVHLAISPEAPDIRKFVEVANQHKVTFAATLTVRGPDARLRARILTGKFDAREAGAAASACCIANGRQSRSARGQDGRGVDVAQVSYTSGYLPTFLRCRNLPTCATSVHSANRLAALDSAPTRRFSLSHVEEVNG